MKLLIGLGNPGSEYAQTRHNAGFNVLEAVAARLVDEPQWQERVKFRCQILQTPDLILAKPQTFMNDSGTAVQALLKFYKIANDDLWVVHDDLDLELGKYKIQKGTGPKVHNGLASIYQTLGSQNFWHVRVGIDSRQGDRTLPGQVYVLQPIRDQERIIFDQTVQEVVAEITKRLT